MTQSAQVEAVEILGQAVNALASGGADLPLWFRQCQHACELLGWVDQRDWFRRELQGYPPEADLPPYRTVKGSTRWITDRGMHEIIHDVVREEHGLRGREPGPPEPGELEVRGPLSWVTASAQTGHSESAGETREQWSDYLKRNVTATKRKVFPGSGFQLILDDLARMVFDFASSSYAALRYGNTVNEVWQDRRRIVDAALHRAGLSAHLGSIDAGLASTNPESWRASVIGCRALIDDLANYVWVDARGTYGHLPGDGQAAN